jgi:DNA-binding CsgD family transcriptional regulator
MDSSSSSTRAARGDVSAQPSLSALAGDDLASIPIRGAAGAAVALRRLDGERAPSPKLQPAGPESDGEEDPAAADIRAAFEDALDRMPQGALLSDATGCVLFANRIAREILATGDGLRSNGERLRADSPDQTWTLRSAIAQVLAPNHPSASGRMLALKRRSLRRPLSVLVTPIGRTPSNPIRPIPIALILVTDPEREAMPAAAQLRQLYDFTSTEAQVALLVARGEGVSAAAETLGVTRSTVRTHLLRIFEKTNTTRQAELVRLLLRSGIREV